MNRRPWRGGQRSWTLSILFHLAIVGVIAGLWYWAARRPRPVESMGIEARVVTSDALTATPAPPPEPDPAPVPEPESPPQETPPVETGPTPEEIAAQAAEETRVAEERRLATEREVAERTAAAQKAERERKEKERKEKEKAAHEKAEKDKAEKIERERLAREKTQKEAAEKARQQREDELTAQLASEDRLAAVRASGLQNQYIALLIARVESAWKKPPNVTAGLDCEVRVTQVPGGAVTAVTVGRCNGDETVRRSIENAVLAASPLPPPPDPALFDRNLKFNFRPTK